MPGQEQLKNEGNPSFGCIFFVNMFFGFQTFVSFLLQSLCMSNIRLLDSLGYEKMKAACRHVVGVEHAKSVSAFCVRFVGIGGTGSELTRWQ